MTFYQVLAIASSQQFGVQRVLGVRRPPAPLFEKIRNISDHDAINSIQHCPKKSWKWQK